MRCAFIIDRSLPLGLIANTAAILAMSLGRTRPEWIGPDVRDGAGGVHTGITAAVLPILAADADGLRHLRARAVVHAADGLAVIDVTETAQRAKTYDAYETRLGQTGPADLRYFGLCLHGPADLVRSLTGNLPLMK